MTCPPTPLDPRQSTLWRFGSDTWKALLLSHVFRRRVSVCRKFNVLCTSSRFVNSCSLDRFSLSCMRKIFRLFWPLPLFVF
jgi:hypothetical protein